MAIVQISGIQKMVGQSGDSKPTTGVPAGSIFYEVTEGDPNEVRTFMFDGSEWGLVVQTTEALPE